MTRTGKCDVCRMRKVKVCRPLAHHRPVHLSNREDQCDEQRPRCFTCRKVGRECTYSYGRPSVFVVEDPTQFSDHGKVKVAPLVYSLYPEGERCKTTVRPVSKHKDTSWGSNNTRAVSTCSTHRSSTPPFRYYVTGSMCSPSLVQPWCPQSSLRARFVTILSSHLQDHSPFVIDTLWADTIPARIGYSTTFDLAVESAMDSFDCLYNDTYSTRRTAILSRTRALRGLRKELERDCLSFSVAQAIRMHFYSEVFLDFTNWPGHHLHMRGLFDVLKIGNVNLDEDQEGYWIFLQSTYVDEVIEATYRGTHSRFDIPLYLVATRPTTTSLFRPTFHIISMTLMHCWVQIPRLICLVRAARCSRSPSALPKAIALASALWEIAQAVPLETYLASTTAKLCVPSDCSVADIIGFTLQFDSVYNLMLVLHYWALTIYLCGLTHTLHTCFPADTTSACFPSIDTVIKTDTEAAVSVAQALVYALSSSACSSLPLLLFRILGPLQTSTGSWLRAIKHIDAASSEQVVTMAEAYNEAQPACREKRMVQWIVETSKRAASKWGFPSIDLGQLEQAREFVSGGTDWHGLDLVNGDDSSERWKKRVQADKVKD